MAGSDAIESLARGLEPAHGRHPDVERVEVRVVWLHARHDGVLEADALERLVPLRDGPHHRVAVLQGHAAVDPEHDRLHRLGHCRRRVLLLESPASDVALGGRACVLLGEVEHLNGEVAHALIRQARHHRLVGKTGEGHVQAQHHAARIRQVRRCPGDRRARGCTHGRLRQVGRVEVGIDVERQLGRCAPDAGKARVPRLERIVLAVLPLQCRADAEHVVEQQGCGVDQNRLALRMSLAGHRHAAQQAVGEPFGHGACFRGVLGTRGDARVDRHQLDQVVDAAELDQLVVQTAAPDDHRTCKQTSFAEATRQLG
jgi:hypothetical protein